MPKDTSRLVLRDGDLARLESLSQSPGTRAELSTRARIILLAAADVSLTDIARQVGVTRQTVVSWRDRYQAGGITALRDVRRPGRPPVHDEVSIVVTTLKPPPPELGVDRWTSRLMADQLGLSFASVARIWRTWGLSPRQVDSFALGTEPELPITIRDVRGLYLAPPVSALVLRLNDADPAQTPDTPDDATATALLTALDQAHHTGAAGGAAKKRTAEAELVDFLNAAAKAHPGEELHVVLDSGGADHPAVHSWFAKHPRVIAHATESTESWLTIVHLVLGLAAGPTADPGAPHEITRAVGRLIDTWPQGRPAFSWSAGAAPVVAKAAKSEKPKRKSSV